MAMASTPVRATDPPAKAFRSRKMVNIWVPGCSANGGALRWCAAPVAVFTRPTPMASRAIPTKRYVGIAKMLPDSRMPRRLAAVTRMMTSAPSSTLYGAMASKAVARLARAEALETATVIT